VEVDPGQCTPQRYIQERQPLRIAGIVNPEGGVRKCGHLHCQLVKQQ
jgi:hypothetical protein